MWGIIPAAGPGSRIQPLALSKELPPVGSRRPMSNGHAPSANNSCGAHDRRRHIKPCFVISADTSDIPAYYGGRIGPAGIAYDHWLDDAVEWLRRLGVKHRRTGLSWAGSFRPNAEAWFDREMDALAEYADFFARMVRHYASPSHRTRISDTSSRTQPVVI